MRDFFKKLVMETMENRELKHIIRPDMIHLLMEAKKGNSLRIRWCADLRSGYDGSYVRTPEKISP